MKGSNPQVTLRAQQLCEARHGFAKSTQEVASRYSVIKPLDTTSCVDFPTVGQIVDCCTTGWSPANMFVRSL